MKCPNCKTEIDEHEANRCLDGWVAEAVMGWKRSNHGPADLENWRSYPDEWYENPGSLTIENVTNIPAYSTYIAAAWEVVLDFTGRQYHVRVDGEDAFAYSVWSCAIYAPLRDEGDGPIGEGLDTSKNLNARMAAAPLAICRAALKASKHES